MKRSEIIGVILFLVPLSLVIIMMACIFMGFIHRGEENKAVDYALMVIGIDMILGLIFGIYKLFTYKP